MINQKEILYVLSYKLLGILRIGDTLLFSYDEFIQEQDVPEHKTTIIGSCIGREIRQESYLATKYEKARQDVGLFLYLHIKKF